MMMKTRKVMKPGQPGTKKWMEKYGEDLYCVRYRYDDALKRKIITVELIVEESHWEENSSKIPLNKRMPLQVGYNEVLVRKLVKSVGGRWNRAKKVWELEYGEIVSLGLENRIVKE